jgi:predicted secreted protein
MTETVINGTNLRLYVDGDVVGRATSCSLSMSKELAETVHKDNIGGWATQESRKKSFSIAFEGFTSELQTLNSVDVKSSADLFDIFNASTPILWKFTTDETGDTQYAGSAHLSELSINAAVEENSTTSGSFTGTGAITKTTIA